MNKFVESINGNQRQLLFSVNLHANQCGFSRVFSARLSAWEACVAEVSRLLTSSLLAEDGITPVSVAGELGDDPIAGYGADQAQTHARYQISASTFLGDLKCFRCSFEDLLGRTNLSSAERVSYQQQLNNFFDRIDLGFSRAWEHAIEIAQPDKAQTAGG